MLAEPSSQTLDTLRFLTPDLAEKIAAKYGTPVYVYSEDRLLAQAHAAKAFPAPYGLTVRFAMKANPLAGILKVFNGAGLHIDASSENEVYRAIKAGFKPSQIMLTSQQLPRDLSHLVELGVIYNPTSLHQLETYGRSFPGRPVSIRVNAGLGSGYTRSVSVAGPTSSFGIWFEQLDEAQQLIKRHKLTLRTIHSHIGCGNDPEVYIDAARNTLDIVERFPTVTNLNLGGGFKVARNPGERATNLQLLGGAISDLLRQFNDRTSRMLHLEIEPGTMLVANCGTLLTSVQDIVSTGSKGFTFLKLDTGMNDILRPALHGSRHPIVVLDKNDDLQDYVVVGHNCESTDLLTPSPEDSETPLPRTLPRTGIGKLVAIEGVGAYCSSMRVIGYNSFTSPNEVLVRSNGDTRLINRSLGVDDYTSSEIYN